MSGNLHKKDHSGPRVGDQAGKKTKKKNRDAKSSGVGNATVSSTFYKLKKNPSKSQKFQSVFSYYDRIVKENYRMQAFPVA